MGPAVTHRHAEEVRFPLMENPHVGAVLALIAGCLNAYTLFTAKTFATVQSGNVVQIGYRLMQGQWKEFWFSFIAVLAFGLGSLVCGAIMTMLLRKGRSFTVGILAIEAGTLIVLGAFIVVNPMQNDTWGAAIVSFIISFVAGMQGNAFHKNNGMLYGNVAVTFVVQMAFNFLVQAVFQRDGIDDEPNLRWAGIFFYVLFGFAAGGAIGSVLVALSGWSIDPTATHGWGGALWLPAALLIALAVLAVPRMIDRDDPDPTPGGLIG